MLVRLLLSSGEREEEETWPAAAGASINREFVLCSALQYLPRFTLKPRDQSQHKSESISLAKMPPSSGQAMQQST